MEPTLTWLDLTVRDRERMRRVLDLFKEPGTVDEMGLGTLRDALADSLFPGTSSIQTRLRYALFIPWIYQRLEANRVSSENIAHEARDAEIALINPLTESDDPEGVIGARAGATLTRLPSHVYWAGLVRWGIFQQRQSQSWYHGRFTRLVRARFETGRADDPGVVWSGQPVWHPRLPKAPAEFPAGSIFRLSPEESEFMCGRFEETCRGTLLAWLAREGRATPAESFWQDPDALRAGEPVRRIIELARRFSLHVEGIPLLYNLLLARYRNAEQGGDEDLIEWYTTEIAEWAALEQVEAPFDPGSLWNFVMDRGVRLADPQRRFVEAWSARVNEIGANKITEDTNLRELVRNRELHLKKNRARFVNRTRLLEWRDGSGVGRMDFRWFRVRQLLIDLHRGFQD